MAYEIGQTCMLVNMGLTRSECASWVQAWGSLLAVAGAAIGIWWQVRRQERLRLADLQRAQDEREAAKVADEVRRLSVIAGAIFQCIVILRRVEMASQNRWDPLLEQELDYLQRQVDRLTEIPALDVPDLYAAHAIGEAHSVVRTLRLGLAAADRDLRVVFNVAAQDVRHYRRTPHMNAAVDNFLNLESTLKRCLQQRGSDLPLQTARLNDEVLHSTEVHG